MSQKVIYPVTVNSLQEFSERCYNTRTPVIDVNFSASIKEGTVTDIDRYDMSIDSELIVVPLHISCLGKAGNDATYYRRPHLLRSRYFAYFHKPEVGNMLRSYPPINLEDICEKAKRFALQIGLSALEQAETQQQSYDFTIRIFLTVAPHGRKEKKAELKSEEITSLSTEDYIDIIEKQQHSRPWL